MYCIYRAKEDLCSCIYLLSCNFSSPLFAFGYKNSIASKKILFNPNLDLKSLTIDIFSVISITTKNKLVHALQFFTCVDMYSVNLEDDECNLKAVEPLNFVSQPVRLVLFNYINFSCFQFEHITLLLLV